MPNNLEKPVRIRGWVSLGTRYSEFYWWDDKTNTLWGDYDNVMRLDWDRRKITEQDLPTDCLAVLNTAREMLARGEVIPEYSARDDK
jgi:hypothetical protein